MRLIFFNFKGDISLDDISLVEGSCPTDNVYSCDFELGLCGLTNDLTSKFNWKRSIAKSASSYSTGPREDHTVFIIFIKNNLMSLLI